MTTGAEPGAFFHLQLPAIARAEQFEVGRVMTIEALVVAIVASVADDQILVFFGQNDVVVRIQVQFHCLFYVVTCVAGHAGGVAPGADQFRGRQANRGGVGELGIHQRERGRTGRSSP